FARRTEGFEEVGGNRLAELEPDLAGRFDRALFFADEAHLDPRAAMDALGRGLAERGIVTAAEMPEGAEDEQVIDCRGLAARDILPDLRGVRGEMLVLRCPEVTLSRPVRLLHPRVPIYLVPRGDGVFMLGATMIESDRRGIVTARSVMELLSAAFALHPAFGEAEIVELGADARPAFPDNLPRIRHAGGRLCANGLYRHGYLLAPAVAMQVADYLETGEPPEFMTEDTHATDDQR
ncbi:MAG TPA: FAD-dependent oxidoreductase, partial [Paracoccus sp. (in: a-proteobacteria)]|nr:FAD-dependent oxidoreductase [Paracoccus sp. (in: a-proteobacteria)]